MKNSPNRWLGEFAFLFGTALHRYAADFIRKLIYCRCNKQTDEKACYQAENE